MLPIDIDICGIDFSEEVISVAKKLHSEAGISYLLGEVRNIPLKNESVNITICINVIHHVLPADLPETLNEVARISGNILILEIKNKNDIYTRYFKRLSVEGITVYPTSFKRVSRTFEMRGFKLFKKKNIFLLSFIFPIQIVMFQRIKRSR